MRQDFPWHVPLLFFLFLASASSLTMQGVTTTVASRQWIFPAGPLAATDAPLGRLSGVAVDSAGNLFAADSDNHLVVRISPSGVLTVVAGNRVSGFSGDGGPATSASLYGPFGVAADAAGNLYIADCLNHRVRKVSPAGIMTTAGGNGVQGFSGDGGPASSARVSGVT